MANPCHLTVSRPMNNVAPSNLYPSRRTERASPESTSRTPASVAFGHTRGKADFNLWERWIHESPENEMRPLAFKAVRACVENDDKALDLRGLALTDLPDGIPLHVEELDLSDNKLKALPHVLPLYLKCLRAEKNRLTSLPKSLPR